MNNQQGNFVPSMLKVPFFDPYTLDVNIEQLKNGTYEIVAVIDFLNGSYTASPLSDKNYTGAFKIEIADEKNLKLNPTIEEIPRSKPTTDEFGGIPQDWVREKTTYRQRLILQDKMDFEVGGKVSFTIEPRCTFEEIPFMIKFKNGIMTIEPWGC
jgi:hypothetical protein